MSRRTIGVAIAIPEPHGAELQAYRESYGDPLARAIPSHVTLLPPTTVHDDELPAIEEHLRKVALAEQPFDLHLRGTGTFRPVSPVVFVQLSRGIAHCERVEAQVRSGPLDRQLSFYYHPHVTVAHDLEDHLLDRAFDELADFECQFDADKFLLYVHDEKVGWQPTREFPLLSTT